jgi:hypothetical protein
MLAWSLWLGLAATPASVAQETETPPDADSATQTETRAPAGPRDLLDTIREDLVQLRLEKALAGIEALLADPGLQEAERQEALILRAQTHGAIGDFEAVEQDYRQILRVRPGYVPDASLTPDKAMARFRAVRDAMIGTLLLTLEPPDARLLVDGADVAVPSDGSLALLAGDRVLRAEAPGYDPEQQRIAVEPGSETPLRFQLIPNARTLVVRTVPDRVTVKLDGREVGQTRQPFGAEKGAGLVPAELELELVPLGEHVIELSKPCFTPVRIEDFVSVDLLDTSPKRYDAVVMTPARAGLTIEGGPPGGRLRIDGKAAGTLPLAEPLSLCPGEVQVEVRAGGRPVWLSRETLAAEGGSRLTIDPRPGVLLVGTESWPDALAALGDTFSTMGTAEVPRGSDLERADGWSRIALPSGADLALAVLPPAAAGGADRWLIYSPHLQRVEPLTVAPVGTRPAWSRVVWGLELADSRVGDASRVIGIAAGGPAEAAGVRPGDRISAVDGAAVANAAATREALGRAPVDRAVSLTLLGPDGESREVELRGVASPRLLRAAEHDRPVGLLAAWAAVDSVGPGDTGALALANLALLLSRTGSPHLAVEQWRRVRLPERAGLGAGTVAYYLGRDLLALGREEDAVEAFRRAASSAATAFDDEGPAVAPAAEDHLVDLGVASRR